ncbi:hypothetical protein E1265_26745 [Streptomyces sp. 8K308]|uniref:hypothetical protein n=1 Tax=Streptomyces sp. 8K308 TaxID=2530388 RepID=UPI00104C8508|nr:hypothetical protein [Streptomyces sp. 8K308]TDC15438.1 hypothetical protein E1265_26745 [Streptomyces sp. 8K308]
MHPGTPAPCWRPTARTARCRPGEIDRALPALLDFRHAINAVYYAQRLLRGDTTGVPDQAANAARLAEARRWLVGAGAVLPPVFDGEAGGQPAQQDVEEELEAGP